MIIVETTVVIDTVVIGTVGVSVIVMNIIGIMDPALSKMEYIKKKVDPFLSKLMVDILVKEPADPV